jgi:thiamine pyrophosphokinase
MHSIIFVGGTLRAGKAVEKAIASADLILAADSGAIIALQYGCTPAIIVGDFDSLTLSEDDLVKMGSQLVRAEVKKNETDTELAVQVALERGAERITILGGIGGERFDHTMANVLLLAGFETIPMQIVDGPATCWLLRGPGSTAIEGQPGDLLSLLPLTREAVGVRTTDLYYPLYGEVLYFGKPRGVSNVLIGEHARVSLERGLLLVIHTNKDEITPWTALSQ